MLLEGGLIGQVRRSQVLGSVATVPTRGEAQALLDERLRAVNAGASRPEAFMAFGTFVEQQWNALVFPTFKASTQHSYKTVLHAHVLPAWREWRLRDIERLAIQQIANLLPELHGVSITRAMPVSSALKFLFSWTSCLRPVGVIL